MKFSIIIPAYNPEEKVLSACIRSTADATGRAEVLVVDDGSASWPPFCACTWHLPINGGPGIARNAALEKATGDWIIFLDSDDQLLPGALECLSAFIAAHPDVDVIGFGWEYAHLPGVNQRKDSSMLNGSKDVLLREYLKLHMDGSVIFTAVKRSLIEQHGLRFRAGLHEDVDFLFKVYLYAKKTAYLPEILYHKTEREGSIIKTISERHLTGFIEGWSMVGECLPVGGCSSIVDQNAYKDGTVNVLATRVREIWRHGGERAESLLDYLGDIVPVAWHDWIGQTELKTQYAQAAKAWLAGANIEELGAIFHRKWSCRDIQGALFLAPDEARTCCKRFFVDGEMRGDVVLLDRIHARMGRAGIGTVKEKKIVKGALETEYEPYTADPTVESIFAAKHALVEAINKGEPSPCSGCPFMEFKEWEPMSVRYLSMEHHSVCNMRCTYCDEGYYGGLKAQYDVEKLLRDLHASGLMRDCREVVWGGGEPTAGSDFEQFVTLPGHYRQRFLTNATKFSPAIANTLECNRGTVTTSIDAGNEETFAKVRGGKVPMSRVLTNLRLYAKINPQAVTVKYIITDDNHAPKELAFVTAMETHSLLNCNFQISADFKSEQMSMARASFALLLHSMLLDAGAKVIFFDDLLLQRMPSIQQSMFPSSVAQPEDYRAGIVLWGSGAMTEWMLKNTHFLRNVKIVARNEYVPNTPALITGSQSYPDTYRRALAAGTPEELIIRGMVL